MNNINKIFAVVTVFLLSACFGSKDKVDFGNNRASKPSELVDLMDKGEKDQFVESFLSRLPKPVENNLWLRNGYFPAENIELTKNNDLSFESIDIGKEPKRGLNITSTPVAGGGFIFTIGGQGEIQARTISNPEEIIWQTIIEQDNLSQEKHGVFRTLTNVFYESETFLGGNICYSSGVIFASTKRGNVFAMNSKDGEVLWKRELHIPIRSAPVAHSGKVVVTTSENKTYALNASNGKTDWVHEGLAEKSKLSTSPAPLIHKGKIVLTYSSGEVYQLNLENGKEVWSTITSPNVITVLNPSINDIGFSPLLHKGRVFVVTSSGRVVALDYATGNTLFEFDGYQINKPLWAVSDSIFAVTKYGQLLSFSASTGKLAWQVDLDNPEEIDDEKILFSGAVMANGLLYIADNQKYLRAYYPENGNLASKTGIPSGVIHQPIVVSGKIFLIKSSGDPKLIYFK